jgi:hypothetical protein
MRAMSWFAGCVGLIAVAGTGQAETVGGTGTFETGSPCLAVAAAKQAQWTQVPLLIDETRSYADDTTANIQTVFTSDHAYGRYSGRAWNSVSYRAPERDAKTPAEVARAMRLESCQLIGPTPGGGAHLYSFTYLPDRDGTRSSGQMTVSDTTGLPLSQEIVLNKAHPGMHDLIKIVASFTYGDAAKVPRDAALAEIDQRAREQNAIRDLQNRSATMAPQ